MASRGDSGALITVVEFVEGVEGVIPLSEERDPPPPPRRLDATARSTSR